MQYPPLELVLSQRQLDAKDRQIEAAMRELENALSAGRLKAAFRKLKSIQRRYREKRSCIIPFPDARAGR